MKVARPTHWHVAVFHGPEARYDPGLVVHHDGDRWEVVDETGRVGPAGTTHGTFTSGTDACREALRLMRARLGESVVPCWGAGAPNELLSELGYDRGRLRWRWWPPGFVRVGETSIGLDGGPDQPTAS